MIKFFFWTALNILNMHAEQMLNAWHLCFSFQTWPKFGYSKHEKKIKNKTASYNSAQHWFTVWHITNRCWHFLVFFFFWYYNNFNMHCFSDCRWSLDTLLNLHEHFKLDKASKIHCLTHSNAKYCLFAYYYCLFYYFCWFKKKSNNNNNQPTIFLIIVSFFLTLKKQLHVFVENIANIPR